MKNFDNASTTKISENSLKTYVEASEQYYNPSSLYLPASKSKLLLEEARNCIMKYLKAKQGSTLIFTGCATESNNAVLKSCITRKDKNYIVSAGEHSSIYATAKNMLEQGFDIRFCPLKPNGQVDEQKLFDMVDDKTAFVSIIHVSNETGAINDINKIASELKRKNKNLLFHSDGVQAIGKLKIDLSDIDFYTISAHKINGPKGIGALYIANSNKFKPFLLGGGQENNLRAGTENLPAICAFVTAIKDLKLHDYSLHKAEILKNLTGDYVLVSDSSCVDNIISVCFKGVRGETIEHQLESKGYLIGTGSACNSKAGLNRVLAPIVPKDYIEGAIRISFADDVSLEDCKNLATELSKATKEYVQRIRK